MMQNGVCYQQAPLVLRTSESVCFLLPTPTASDGQQYSIMSNATWRPDQANGKPRKVLPDGRTASAGLCRLWMLTGYEMPAEFSEMMMGYPLGWTDLEH